MKKIIITLLSIFSLFSVYADEEITTEEIKNENLYKAGENVLVEGNYDGISFVAGYDVEVNTKSLFGALAGQAVRFNGSIQKDLFAAGAEVAVNGYVERDAYVAAQEVEITGVIDGNLYVASEKLVISENAEIKGNVKFYGTEFENKGKITGMASYYEDAVVSGLDGVQIKTMKHTTTEVSLKDKIINVGYSLLRYLFVFMVLAFTFPKLLKYIKTKYVFKNITDYLATSGTGIIGMFLFPIIAILLLISNIGLSVGLIMFVLYIIMIYITTIISGYILGNILTVKLLKKEGNDYIVGLVGITTIIILSYIPYLGTFVNLINVLFGFGVIIKMLINRENRTL